ncbi:MAG: peptidylprolyl isomerase [Thermomicrobiales bacterium]|nr:peptidylprolyl isomerase [Thermomicrobiales bacterium]
MTERREHPAKPTRQQQRARAREKRDANGWIVALGVGDPEMARAIRSALGNRHATRAQLEEALGISLASAGADQGTPAPERAAEPERITLQHVLVAFAGTGTRATRTRGEAEALATETLARAREGEPFDDLVRELTDDAFPGIYQLCNSGIVPEAGGEFRRDAMVPAFGDVGFTLAPGEIGMAAFAPRTSPFGWHIIKRIA